jgi:transposase-like protein
MSERGVVLTYETIRQWSLKFGQQFANDLRRRRPRPGDKWHLDEVFIRINAKTHYLWRAIDQYGDVLDILVRSRRDKKAAKKFFRKLLKGLQTIQVIPVRRVVCTDAAPILLTQFLLPRGISFLLVPWGEGMGRLGYLFAGPRSLQNSLKGMWQSHL